MDTLVKADIFFFITSIAVIAVSIGILVGIYYIIRAIKKFEDYADRLEKEVKEKRDEVEEIKNDVKEIAQDIRESFVYNLLFKKGKKRKK